MGVRVSKERITEARKADLYDFLTENHKDQFYIEAGYLRYKDDRSITIKKGFPGFCDHEGGLGRKKGGNPIDFLVKFLGYDFTDAVIALTEDGFYDDFEDDFDMELIREEIERKKQYLKERMKEGLPLDGMDEIFEAPERNSDAKRLYAYLIRKRGIDPGTVSMLVKRKLIYQDENGNIVFMSKDHDWAELRGTNDLADKRCSRADDCDRYECSEHGWCRYMDQCPKYKSNPFHGMVRCSKRGGFWSFSADDKYPVEKVYICEAGVDAVSLYELHRLKGNCIKGNAYCSIGGCGKTDAIESILDLYKEKAVIAVDNDEAGDKCRERFPDIPVIIPESKDWNDDLKIYKGMKS